MIKKLFLRFGSFGTTEPLTFEPTAMTVFVGPNNSGKSLILRELQMYLENGRPEQRHIVEGIELAVPPDNELRSMLDDRKAIEPLNQFRPEGQVFVVRTIPSSGSSSNMYIHRDELLRLFPEYRSKQEDGDTEWWKTCWSGIYQQFASLFTVALDGKTRLGLTEQRDAGDLLQAPANHLAALFARDTARKRVRSITYEAFNRYFVIDPTDLGRLRIRMSTRAPNDDQEEQALDDRARKFHAAATDIAELSDGVKAFTGLISALISSDYRIMLVDEPEAFLHPPLAGQLGREMATISDERSGNVFASTHSSRFLVGCVESGKSMNIIRLTYNAPHATARFLPAKRIQELMRDPLLRSAGVLDALFYSSAVICEADKDRVFYAEINNRLQSTDRLSIRDAVFLNAQNKQTVRRIVGPLRSMGVPAVAVVDFDIIKGNDLRDLLKACFVPAAVAHSLGQLRGDVESVFREQDLNMKKGGLSLLTSDARESCQSLIDQLAAYGIFAVPNGEVESWLGYLGVDASKENWLPTMFDRMMSDPNDPDYVRPQNGDVWQFLESMQTWIQNEDRLGMPRQTNVEAGIVGEAYSAVGVAEAEN